MKILLTSIGTRGDMEPFLSIAVLLKNKGHEVTCLFPEQFRVLAEESDLPFESLGTDFIEMLHSSAGKLAMSGGAFGIKKVKAYITLLKIQKPINKAMVLKQQEVIERLKPDRIVHNGKAIVPVIWGIENPEKRFLVSPVPFMHYVKDQAHIAFNRNFGPRINKWTYDLANFGLIQMISSSFKWMSKGKKLSTRRIKDALFTENVIYTISPSLFKRPHYWPKNWQVLGYHERVKTHKWKADSAIEDFLKKHPKVMLVSFGSMQNNAPETKTQVILEVLRKNGIPAIINTAAGGLVKPKEYDQELFHFTQSIPYDWLLPKVYAFMHHGGSGTTHSSLKNGCATMIIPHIIDQYVWNKIIAKQGAGPLGIDVSKLDVNNLESKIHDLWNKPIYKQNAERIALQMQTENFENELEAFILEE